MCACKCVSDGWGERMGGRWWLDKWAGVGWVRGGVSAVVARIVNTEIVTLYFFLFGNW